MLKPAPRTFLFEDYVEQTDNGALVVIGRVDSIVKIGGHRVSLQKVERELLKHGAVNAAVAVSAPGPSGMERIIAAVLVDENSITDKELRLYYRTRIPTVELPERLVLFKSFPTTASGKLDRMTITTQLKTMSPGSAN